MEIVYYKTCSVESVETLINLGTDRILKFYSNLMCTISSSKSLIGKFFSFENDYAF